MVISSTLLFSPLPILNTTFRNHLPLFSPPHCRGRGRGRRPLLLIRAKNGGRGESAEPPDRLISAACYLYPFLDGVHFGRFLLLQFPPFQLFLLPFSPAIRLFRASPLNPLLLFLTLYFAVVRNPSSFSRYVRFNTMQAIVLDVLLIFPDLIEHSFAPQDGIGLNIVMSIDSTVFLFLLISLVYGSTTCLMGQVPRLPIVAEAADRQFSKNSAYLYDLGSTHGTFVNKNQVKKKVYTEIHVGDVIRFGQSSRLYIFQGPAELMPPEGDLEKLRKVKVHEENCDREASLSRAKKEALFANGISWGMTEDAIEEELENDADEITWQTYKGQLTERQEKMHSKIIKRMEKVSNMKKEIDAIRAKDIAQGGLTQGQQTQIARNEQRISQIMEELDSLEETMNDSIRESLGARAAKSVVGRTKVNNEEEEDVLSEDDEFYDRTKKKISAKKSGEVQSVETADTLLDKIDAISSEIEEKRKLLAEEKDKVSSTEKVNQGEDDLDAFMSGLSSQLVIDNTTKMENTLDDLHVELERTKYLLGIADPSGEASRRRAGKAAEPQVPQCTQPIAVTSTTESPSGKARNTVSSKPKDSRLVPEEKAPDKAVPEEEKVKEVYTIAKPQWLGATRENPSEAGNDPLVRLDNNESDEFVDYKDRKKFLSAADDNGDLENAAPGLIIRKRKQAENLDYSTGKPTKVESPSSTKAETAAADAVALLLKHKRGFYGSEEATDEEQTSQGGGHPVKEGSRTRRVLGPARPDFIDRVPDYETWVPPKGQTGDGRTSLNDRLGY